MAPIRLRSVLLAPGNRAEMTAKLPRSSPDAGVLDLEDAVPAHAKAAAREDVRSVAADLVRTEPQTAWFVRVNPPATEWFDGDVREALVDGLAGVVVPKLESAADVAAVTAALAEAGFDGLGVFAGLETAAGVEAAPDVLGGAGVVGAYFGAEDYIADVGGVRTEAGAEVLYARSRVVLAGRLAGVPVVDQVVTDFRDDDRFRRDAAAGRSLGFAGKLCIHPGQVALAHEAFTPSEEEVDRARRLLATYEAAATAGRAAIDFEGRMVDEPLARQARNILATAEG